MGHQTRNDLEIDPEKVEAIQNMKQPTYVEDVRRFVGMANFVARYIPSFTDVLHPLHNLMKNTIPFSWPDNQQTAIEKVKRMLTVCLRKSIKKIIHNGTFRYKLLSASC